VADGVARRCDAVLLLHRRTRWPLALVGDSA